MAGPRAPSPATLRSAWAIAWPASLAAIVTPLLGLIDIAVLARAAGAEDLAGASLAGAVFSLLYWSFGFLRKSLSGLAAQALGANRPDRLRGLLVQGAGFGAAIGVLLILLAPLIGEAAQRVFVEGSEASPAAGGAMQTYLRLRILAAPAALCSFAVVGWLTGQGRTGLMMLVTVGTASINGALSVFFVLKLGHGIAGLAVATALAELSGLLIGGGAVLFVLKDHGGALRGWSWRAARENLDAIWSLNRDIFLRTLVLTLILVSFARIGAGFGDITVAANHVLLNLVLAVTLLLDGSAIAAETFIGQALGAGQDRIRLFRAAWQKTAIIAAGGALFLLLGLLVFGDQLLVLTVGKGPNTEVILAEARRFLPWAIIMPIAVGAAYHLDGVYIGATRGAAIRNTMLVSGLFYASLIAFLLPPLGNHGLWLALTLFMAFRGLALIATWRGFGPLLRDHAPGQ